MEIVGIDLAWQSENNTTALVVGDYSRTGIQITTACSKITGMKELIDIISKLNEVVGVSIDGPLVITNKTGQRICEKQLSREYGNRYASCHSSNLSSYPNPASCVLSSYLSQNSFSHLASEGKWQLECYPHPAIIEIFGLPVRLKYKKGRVAERKQGQIQLANFIKALEESTIFPLQVSSTIKNNFLTSEAINSKGGARLKQNEDILDSIICAYIGALFMKDVPSTTFGTISKGYIYVPQAKCI
jgi:predicted RNase H-like nuclease